MNFMVFCQVFSNVSIAYRGDGWWDGAECNGLGWGWQKIRLGHPWSSHDACTLAHATLVGHRGSGRNLMPPPPNY